MNVGDVVLVAGAIFGSGGVSAGWNAWQSHKAGVRASDVQEDANALAGFTALTEGLQKEVTRLQGDRDADRARIDRIEAEIAIERDLKWSAIQYARALLAWIAAHIPATAGPIPEPPDDLTQHIHPPQKEQP